MNMSNGREFQNHGCVPSKWNENANPAWNMLKVLMDIFSFLLRSYGTNVRSLYFATSFLHLVIDTPNAITRPQLLSEEAAWKRQLRLLKKDKLFRIASGRKKEYVKCLKNHLSIIEIKTIYW